MPDRGAECTAGEMPLKSDVRGRASGFLLLHCLPPAARRIAADFLGADEASVSALADLRGGLRTGAT